MSSRCESCATCDGRFPVDDAGQACRPCTQKVACHLAGDGAHGIGQASSHKRVSESAREMQPAARGSGGALGSRGRSVPARHLQRRRRAPRARASHAACGQWREHRMLWCPRGLVNTAWGRRCVLRPAPHSGAAAAQAAAAPMAASAGGACSGASKTLSHEVARWAWSAAAAVGRLHRPRRVRGTGGGAAHVVLVTLRATSRFAMMVILRLFHLQRRSQDERCWRWRWFA